VVQIFYVGVNLSACIFVESNGGTKALSILSLAELDVAQAIIVGSYTNMNSKQKLGRQDAPYNQWFLIILEMQKKNEL